MRRAGAAAPGSVPALLGQDAATGASAMEWLPPEGHALWNECLRQGHADPAFAAEVARRLARVHAAIAARRAKRRGRRLIRPPPARPPGLAARPVPDL
jgi:hypothetical protein